MTPRGSTPGCSFPTQMKMAVKTKIFSDPTDPSSKSDTGKHDASSIKVAREELPRFL